MSLPVTYTTSQVAEQLHCSARKVCETANAIGVGMNFGGRAGYRYTAAEVERICDSLRPKPIPAPTRRRKRRAS